MAVPMGIKVPVPFEYVFPAGAMFVGVEAMTDFDRKDAGASDSQARDRDTGELVWQVTVVDNDEEASRFGRSPTVRVKIPGRVAPQPPPAQVAGFRPLVAFEGLTLTPYVDTAKCKPSAGGAGQRCGCRQAYSMRATAMVDPATLPRTASRAA